MTTVVLNPAFLQALLQQADRALGAAVREMRDTVKERVADPYPPVSEPGTPPHRRTGGLQDAVFAERIAQGEWAYGYREVPDRGAQRGLWMELGTGHHRRAPDGEGGTRMNPSGGNTSVEFRPVLLPVLMESGARAVEKHLVR